jgi:hypothetical protein
MAEILDRPSTNRLSRRNRIPVWAAGLVILLVAGGGVWWVYKMVFASKDKPTADVMELEGQYGGYGRRGNGGQPNRSLAQVWGLGRYSQGVTRQPSGAVVACQGDAYARGYMATKGNYNITFDYVARDAWVTPEQFRLHMLMRDESSYARLGLSDDQKKKLAALSYTVTLTAAERKTLEELIRQWDSIKDPSARTSATASLLAAVARTGDAHLAETKAAMLKRVQGIEQILTSQQLDQLRGKVQGGRNNGQPRPTPPQGPARQGKNSRSAPTVAPSAAPTTRAN